MLFGQKVHPLNFEYADRIVAAKNHAEVRGRSFAARVRCDRISPFCARLRFENSHVADKRNDSDGLRREYRKGTPIRPNGQAGGVVFAGRNTRVEVGASWLKVDLSSGARLHTIREGFGFNGERAIFNFDATGATGFYGFGERTRRLNKSGDNLEFWTIDVAFVFLHTSNRDDYDPNYLSIPLAIIRIGETFLGILVDNPHRLIMNAGQMQPGRLIIQSLGGNNDLYFIDGPRLRDVVRNFTELTGRAEVPPLWSMGYHQCRWGYQSSAEFLALKSSFAKHDIPVSAFWYDIDYMDEYRLFTWDRVDIPEPRKLNDELKRAGIRTVAIVDPGVKLDPGYPVYDSGRKENVFCKTSSGRDYVGKVWPGDTVFPDFTLDAVQEWWAALLAKFLKDSSLDGAWLDMNDPATGWSDPDDMLFQEGRAEHAKFHNQYGHYMAKASRRAFARLDPQRRPFLLTRSGYTGTQRYSAIWNGDNDSNWKHLRMAIPCTLNLGLSGVAFNGPDVGGFLGSTTGELLIRWFQAGFLFPFFRNHSVVHSKTQEPWAFGPQVLQHIRDTIHTRYRLLPYLYQCFFQHWLTGDPILRPLLYEFEDRELENLDDQFMVGDSIMCAPIVRSAEAADSIVVRGEKRQLRHVTFPAGWWFDLTMGDWVEGGKTIHYAVGLGEAPLFIRDGAIIPWFNGHLRNSEMSLKEIELHVFAREAAARLSYFIEDDGSRRYLEGLYNTASIQAAVANGALRLDIEETGKLKPGSVSFSPVVYGSGGMERAVLVVNGVERKRRLRQSIRRWVGRDVAVRV